MTPAKKTDQPNQQLLSTLKDFLSARHWATCLDIIEEQHPELLSDEAEALLQRLIDTEEDEFARYDMEMRLYLLRRCKEMGVNEIAKTFCVQRDALSARKNLEKDQSLSSFDCAVKAWENLLSRSDIQLDADLYRSVVNDTADLNIFHYMAFGKKENLDRAIRLSEELLNLTPVDSPDLLNILSKLGIELTYRYALSEKLSDLGEIIEIFRRAASLTPETSQDPRMLTNLGIALSKRYEKKGDLNDLKEAIEAWRTGINLTVEGSPDLSTLLDNLGFSLRTCYDRLGESSDLDEITSVIG